MGIQSLVLMACALVALQSSALANSGTGGGLKNRSDDQACALEKTPLTRCETMGEFLRSDRELNNAYRTLTKQLAPHSLPALRTTQRDWITWRDDKCEQVEAEAKCTNGVCAGVSHDNCVVQLTVKRTKELVEFSHRKPSAQASRFVFDKTYEE